MGQALSELRSIVDQHRFNRERWDAVLADRFLASLDYRIETDRFGHISMMPPAGFQHSRFQGRIVSLLDQKLGDLGSALPECPLSTSAGVKAVDVTWISNARLESALEGSLLVKAPEICVEVISPSNTRPELEEKKRLYFEAGALEVWICGEDGSVSFYQAGAPDLAISSSAICPDFPSRIP